MRAVAVAGGLAVVRVVTVSPKGHFLMFLGTGDFTVETVYMYSLLGP
jgi:hypothetical protein